MIRKFLMSSVALVAITGTAFAADLPSRRAPPVFVPPPIPVFSWTGLYVGGQVGYAFGRETTYVVPNPGVPGDSASTSGVIGGAHIGYNFSTQSLPFLGGFGGSGGVIGIEGDVDGSDASKVYPVIFGVASQGSYNTIQGSIRGRLGFAFDRALFYATGGAAFGEFKNSTSFAGFTDRSDSTRVGYTVGGGVEYAVTTQWSLRAEYRYSDFGTVNEPLVVLAPGFSLRHRETQQRVQVGFSYKFDTPAVLAPVVARY